MNKQKQEEILKKIRECSAKYGDDNIETEKYYKWMDKVWEEAKQHKEEVMKGCGKKIGDVGGSCAYQGLHSWRMCSSCKEIINKYDEVGI